MPYQQVTKPRIEVALAEDVTLRVVAIPGPAAASIFDCLDAPGRFSGSLAQVILDQCGLEVEGTILDQHGEAVEDKPRRLAIARDAILHDFRLKEALIGGVLRHLEALPGNSTTASEHRPDAPGPGTDSE